MVRYRFYILTSVAAVVAVFAVRMVARAPRASIAAATTLGSIGSSVTPGSRPFVAARLVVPPPKVVDGSDGAESTWLNCSTDAGASGCIQCRRDDCASDEVCALNRLTGKVECVGPDCESDQHCPDRWHCRRTSLKSTVKRCVEPGTLGLGDPCAMDPMSPEDSCSERLLCVDGVCSSSCDPSKVDTCPSTHACTETEDGFACVLKNCRDVGCPYGGACVRAARGWVCAKRVIGENCVDTPCRAGETCQVRENGDVIGFRCRQVCDPWRPESCPRGWVCGREGANAGNVCYLACGNNPSVCRSAGDVCSTVTEDHKTWGCAVDVFRPAEALRRK